MIMNQATAMEMLRKEGFEIPFMMVDGQPQEMLSMEAVLRLCDIVGTEEAAGFKDFITGRFVA